MTPLSTTHYRGCKIEIYQDPYAESPRDWDNLGTISYWHKRYVLGDENPDEPSVTHSQRITSELKAILIPVYAYIHSGITIATKPFYDTWDSGQVGYIWCPLGRAIKAWCLGPDATWDTMLTSVYNLPEETLKSRVKRMLEGEIETYDQYLRGECYGYKVIGLDGEELDSCWGYIGTESTEQAVSDAEATIDRHVEDPSNHEQQGEH